MSESDSVVVLETWHDTFKYNTDTDI